MYNWISETLGTVQTIRNSKVAGLLKHQRQTLLTMVQGASGRSGLPAHPTAMMQDSTSANWLRARFNHQPGYALYEKTPFYIYFEGSNIRCTELKFKDGLKDAELSQVLSLFPFEPQPLSQRINHELDTIHHALEPSKEKPLGFHHALLRGHFTTPSTDSAPFIEYSDIRLITVDDKVNLETTLFDQDIPTIILHKDHYYVYGNTTGSLWKISSLETYFIKSQKLPFTKDPFILAYNPQHSRLYQHIFSKNAHTYLSIQPTQTAAIKNIINALYYAELVFIDIEKLSISNYLWGDTHDKAHQALTLITKIDIHFAQRFKNEVLEFLYCIERFNDYSKASPAFSSLLPNTTKTSWPYKLGYAAGFATRHIYSADDEPLNFQVLSQFSAELPQHIDTITTFLNTNIPSVTQHAPNISAAQIAALQKEANKLLTTLKNTQKKSLLGINGLHQIINYIYLIRHLITILTSTVNQIGHLDNARQELLRTYLDLIKNQLFPHIFRLAYKLEIEFILEPGSISNKVMTKVSSFYAFIIFYSKNLADFSQRGTDLLTLEDTKFMNYKRDAVQSLRNDSHKAIIQLSWIAQTIDIFFDTHQRQDFAIIEPHLKKIDPEAANRIIAYLDLRQHVPQEILDLLSIKTRLTAHISKSIASENLRLEQCTAVLAYIDSTANLQVFPYDARIGCDFELRHVNDLIAFKRTCVPQDYPILLLHKEKKTQRSHIYIYGNTDGTQWGLTSIDPQFIHPTLLLYLPKIKVDSIDSKTPRTRVILRYQKKYASLYQQVNLKKAHTRYRSMFDNPESDCFLDKKRLVKLIFEPLDWLNAQLPHPIIMTDSHVLPESRRQSDVLMQNHYISNLEQLSTEEILDLHLWYINKIASYDQACQNMDELQQIIHSHFGPNDPIVFTAQSSLQQHISCLYVTLQPYIIGIRNFPRFDQAMTAALQLKSQNFTREDFQHYLSTFSLLSAKSQVNTWNQRATFLLQQAALRHKNDCRGQDLVPTQIIENPRAGFILKTTMISETLTSFRDAIQQWIPIFNAQIQTKLQVAASGVPYPHIYSLNEQLAHAPYLLFFKRLINAVYHLEQLSKGLEKLKVVSLTSPDKVKTDNITIVQVLWAEHAQHLLTLAPTLYKDPIILGILKQFNAQRQAIVHQIATIAQPHLSSINSIEPVNEKVTHTGLWYALNSFYLMPQHMLAFTEQQDRNMGYTIYLQRDKRLSEQKQLTLIQDNDTYYIRGNGNQWQALRPIDAALITPLQIDFTQTSLNYDPKYISLYEYLGKENYHITEMYDSQIMAKRAALDIEKLIRDSDSYLKLFLSDSRMIWRLNLELRQKIKNFAQTSQFVVMSHLQIMQREYFTPLLMEADRWEHQLGLNCKITLPLKRIIDEWYQGLLFSLKIKFSEKVTLITDNYCVAERIKAETLRLNDATSHLEQTSAEFEHLIQFIAQIKRYKQTQSELTWAQKATDLVLPSETPLELRTYYATNLVPMLQSYKNTFATPGHAPEWLQIIHNQASRMHLDAVETQVLTYQAYLTGIRATYQLGIDNSTEKLKSLKELSQDQSLAQTYRDSYIRNYIEEQIEAHASLMPALNDKMLKTEYVQSLRSHLLRKQDTIIQNMATIDDFELQIAQQIKQETLNFETLYLKRYQQLDRTQRAIIEFKQYLKTDKSLSFDLRQEKNLCLSQLLDQFNRKDSELDLDTCLNLRIQTLRRHITQSEETLLKHQPRHRQFLTWLLDCIISLLTAIGFPPEKQRRYTAMRQAISEPKPSTWCGFFTLNKTTTDDNHHLPAIKASLSTA